MSLEQCLTDYWGQWKCIKLFYALIIETYRSIVTLVGMVLINVLFLRKNCGFSWAFRELLFYVQEKCNLYGMSIMVLQFGRGRLMYKWVFIIYACNNWIILYSYRLLLWLYISRYFCISTTRFFYLTQE